VFAAGENLQGDISNKVYTAQHAYVTPDDVSDPAVRIRASRIRMVPGQYIEAWNRRAVREGRAGVLLSVLQAQSGRAREQPRFSARLPQPLRAVFADDLHLVADDSMDGALHADYRVERGLGVGPDLNLHFGRWGEAELNIITCTTRIPTRVWRNNTSRICPAPFLKTGSAFISAGRRHRPRT